MELHRFIHNHMEAILAEWDAFAQSITPEEQFSDRAVRDHAKQILMAIALDIETYQSSKKQLEKSQGLALDPDVDSTAASIHGALRQENNFSLMQLSAEFRALRATVLRLWLPQVENMSPTTVHSMIRFNEAIDQALSESIAAYSDSADQTRELFLAILGHDLRAPLATMTASGELLAIPQMPAAKIPEIGARVRRSARLMSSMVEDLLAIHARNSEWVSQPLLNPSTFRPCVSRPLMMPALCIRQLASNYRRPAHLPGHSTAFA